MSGLLKPCYVFAPGVLLRRVGQWLAPSANERRIVRLPWGAELEINPREVIGRELLRQNCFDISVSEVAWRLLRPGDRAVDAGANIGYMTSLFAARVGPEGRVDSFEPHPRIFPRLAANSARLPAGAGRVELHGYALGDREGIASLVEPEVFEGNEGTAGIAAPVKANGLATRAFDVRVARLDAVLAGVDVGLLKVDVEGFEPQVLAGADGLLAAHRVRHVIYEAHDCERSAVHGLLARHGYSIFGIGYSLFGLRISAGTGAPAVARGWESPSYLATLEPGGTTAALSRGGWRVLRAARGR